MEAYHSLTNFYLRQLGNDSLAVVSNEGLLIIN